MSAYPQGFKKKINIINQKIGPEKRQEILDEIDYKGMYLPKGVAYEDIDKSFLNFVDTDLEAVIGDELVPVIFLTIQRWAEFSKTWTFSDKFKNIKMPFITVVRQPDIQVGTNQAGIWNIPGHKLYTYIKVPTFDGVRKGMDTYKIPQPTSVDVTYEVRLFCNRMKDLNVFHTIIQKTFNSRQFYTKVNGHPMPIHLENIGDESQIADLDKRRFYVQNFEMKILGYILDENDFEHIPTINRAGIKFIEVKTDNSIARCYGTSTLNDRTIDYSVVFEPNADISLNLNMLYNIEFVGILGSYNLDSITYSVNGSVVGFPFSVTNGDTLNITVTKDNALTGTFILKGNLN